jgi:hypothetical protein
VYPKKFTSSIHRFLVYIHELNRIFIYVYNLFACVYTTQYQFCLDTRSLSSSKCASVVCVRTEAINATRGMYRFVDRDANSFLCKRVQIVIEICAHTQVYTSQLSENEEGNSYFCAGNISILSY